MESEVIKTMLPYVKYTCWGIITIGVGYLAYRRTRPKVVTLNEITAWASKHRHLGNNLFIYTISQLPKETQKAIHREQGMKIILNGYKDEASVLATLTDSNGKIVKSISFMGTVMDEELMLAIGDNGLNIKL